jgi:hypothetical protein
MGKEAILRIFRDYVFGTIRLIELEDWLLSHIQGILHSGNQEAIAMIDKVDALIIEIGEGIASEKELFNTISGFISESETVRVNISIDNIPDIIFGNMNQSTDRTLTVESVNLDFSPHFA